MISDIPIGALPYTVAPLMHPELAARIKSIADHPFVHFSFFPAGTLVEKMMDRVATDPNCDPNYAMHIYFSLFQALHDFCATSSIPGCFYFRASRGVGLEPGFLNDQLELAKPFLPPPITLFIGKDPSFFLGPDNDDRVRPFTPTPIRVPLMHAQLVDIFDRFQKNRAHNYDLNWIPQ